MYIDIARMTLEEVSRITQMLGSAKIDAYVGRVGSHSLLYTVKEKMEYDSIYEPMLTEM